MQIVIEIRDDDYRASKALYEMDKEKGYIRFPAEPIANGIVLSEHHGRLIDADAAEKKICGENCGCTLDECGRDRYCYSMQRIQSAPTIIPATKEKNSEGMTGLRSR